jgi:D-alanine-D-alanine ligase
MLGFRSLENTVAVLFGGRSSEHEISLRSAVFILKNMPEKYRMIPVGIRRTGEYVSLEGTFSAHDFENIKPSDLAEIIEGKTPASLPQRQIVTTLFLPYRWEILKEYTESPLRILNLEAGVVFPVLHGPNGEDGRLQGLMELAETAYVGCDIRASVIGIDKSIQKALARDAGVPVAKFEVIDAEEWFENKETLVSRVEASLGFPAFVKPNALGSAVGCGRANDARELKKLIDEALKFDSKALVEEPMSGSEVECAFLGTGVNPRITTPGEIAPKDFYSYEAKYLNDDGAQLFVPARLDVQKTQELKQLAAKLARVFSLEGLCRIDFWNDKNSGRFVFNEFNSLPGLTSISMFPKLWEHEGVAAQVWIDELIQRAHARQRRLASMQFGTTAE